MKKFTLMLAFAVLSMAANALTIFYKNTNNWSGVAAYTFSEETLGKWPGTQMTPVADHEGWFSIDVDETKASKIIFNNNGGGLQTGDLTIDATQPYYNEGWTSSFDGEVIVDIYTVYYNNVDNWEQVYAYAWGGAAVTASWPGDQMTAVADHEGWYAIDFKGGLPENIIFNNNAGAQSPDLKVDPANLYHNGGWTNSFDGEVVVVVPDAMYLKHDFEGNGTWEWREMTKQEDGTFVRKDYWQGSGANVNASADEAGSKWFAADQITGAPSVTGVLVTYTYDYAAGSLSLALDEAPMVMLVVPATAVVGQEVTFSATVVNMEAPAYVYSVQAPEATDFVALEGATYTPAAEGVYTVKVTATAGDVTLEDTKEMKVIAPVEINSDFYLVGYINGADYGCQDDYETIGEYKFVDGALTATFTEDSYVFVKTGDNQNWFMTMDYTPASPATLYNTALAEAGQKLFVPGNVVVNFTLTVNSDATLTLAYTTSDTGTTPNPGTSTDYYLIGHINGADYGDNEDWENLGEYKFVDGRLTATFTETSYVYVKTGDNKNWYMSASYVEPAETASAVLSIAGETVSEKIGVPANVVVNFTLAENADGTLLLAYTTGGSAVENVLTGYTLRVDNGMLSVTLDKAAQVAVYTLDGQMFDCAFTADYRCTLTAGMYIVRVGNEAQKIVVM